MRDLELFKKVMNEVKVENGQLKLDHIKDITLDDDTIKYIYTELSNNLLGCTIPHYRVVGFTYFTTEAGQSVVRNMERYNASLLDLVKNFRHIIPAIKASEEYREVTNTISNSTNTSMDSVLRDIAIATGKNRKVVLGDKNNDSIMDIKDTVITQEKFYKDASVGVIDDWVKVLEELGVISKEGYSNTDLIPADTCFIGNMLDECGINIDVTNNAKYTREFLNTQFSAVFKDAYCNNVGDIGILKISAGEVDERGIITTDKILTLSSPVNKNSTKIYCDTLLVGKDIMKYNMTYDVIYLFLLRDRNTIPKMSSITTVGNYEFTDCRNFFNMNSHIMPCQRRFSLSEYLLVRHPEPNDKVIKLTYIEDINEKVLQNILNNWFK